MDFGRLNRRIVIQSKSGAVDSVGQPIENWATFATVWAYIRYQSGLKNLEGISSGAEQSTAYASVRIRYRSNVTAAMRIVDGDTTYQIKSVLPNVGAKDYTDLVCEVINGG
jgi:SPP1 family predicted phage head-tail adaptor